MAEVIVKYAFPGDKECFERGRVDAIGSQLVYVRLEHGTHAFSRKDGRWMSGPFLNYKDGVIFDFKAVMKSIEDGDGGEVK